jgi:hypothetical protein
MIAIECILARLTSAVPVPAFAAAGGGQVLSQVFATGSRGDIQLHINDASLSPPLDDRQGFVALDLHRALGQLTQNAPPGPARKIAVLFADFYLPHRPALGVMFDRGFDPGDDPSSDVRFRRVPREGCAVFLGAIAHLRRTPAEWEAEAMFTTIHELGHIFNLQHLNTPLNFMSQSATAAPHGVDAYNFRPHERMLASCSTSPNVWPGGRPFSDTGTFAHHSTPRRALSRGAAFGLDLAIEMAHREFWQFEPVELDVELRVAPGIERSFLVPDAVDTGYDQFDIWIEEPSGERRRHRSPRRYCSPMRRRRISPGRPFRRDISLFGESGGYTFRRSGVHRLWAEFAIRPDLTLRSNVIEVNVRPSGDSRDYRLASRILAAPARARVLYHRLLRGTNPKHLEILRAYAATEPPLASLGLVRYAVATSLAERNSSAGRPLGDTERDLLARALNSPLGAHQRLKAAKLLAKAELDR